MNTDIISYGLDWVGSSGPYLLNLISFFILANQPYFLFWYIVGIFGNFIINIILKPWIKDPRPKEDIKLFELGLTHGKRTSFDQYGMPSGHSQSVGFSCMYIFMVKKNYSILLLYSTISLLTLMQRFKYKNHTILQIIVGFLIGLSTGYMFYEAAKIYLKGKLNKKEDDNCFL